MARSFPPINKKKEWYKFNTSTLQAYNPPPTPPKKKLGCTVGTDENKPHAKITKEREERPLGENEGFRLPASKRGREMREVVGRQSKFSI